MGIEFGTVTLLFTDIQGSTRLWEEHPEAMGNALRRHDAIMRETCTAHGGEVFKTIGDAFCVAFPTAPAAISAALECQLSLNREAWPPGVEVRVRMALHTGAVEFRDDDYFGPPLNRVARLLATAHGGQTVLSESAYNLVRDALPSAATCISLGEHRLRDLGRPELIFQLGHPSLPADFPPLRSLDNPEILHNLPRQVTSFVGREREVAELNELLNSSRLLTLLGPGGAGKTRLALQVAADRTDRYPGGVWFIELASISDPGLLPSAVLRTLGVQESDAGSPEQALIRVLGSKQTLLVLDNCEHLIDAAASLSDAIVRGCENVAILATSREALSVPGEKTYRIPALSTPSSSSNATALSLGQFDAVRLFIDRARLHLADFEVTNANAPALASVCHRLDGIPMAIELAAARVRSMTVEEIDRRLDQRFRLLVGGPRTTMPRQQTLRALIDWSYDLLNDTERALLVRLSVFAGGWSLEAAESVCAGEGVDDWEMLDLLTSLCDKSLVVATSDGDATRYRLLETVRQYASDRLEEAGSAARWADRHLAWCLEFATEAARHLRGPDAVRWLDAIAGEHDNMRAAFRHWSQSGTDSTDGVRLVANLWRFWYNRGYFSEGRANLRSALDREASPSPSIDRAEALFGAGALANEQQDWEDALRCIREALSLFEALDLKARAAGCLSLIGGILTSQTDGEEGMEELDRAVSMAREAGDEVVLRACLGNSGVTMRGYGDLARARQFHEEAHRMSVSMGSTHGQALSFGHLGWVDLDEGKFDSARQNLGLSLRRWEELGDAVGAAWIFSLLGSLAVATGDHTRAQTLHGVNERILVEHAVPHDRHDQVRHGANDAECAAAIGAEACAAAREAGRRMSLEEAIAFALET